MNRVDNHEKVREMIRSILPSTYRKAARQEKAHRKRRHRRQLRSDLRTELPEESKIDVTRDVRITDIAQWRRYGDKLNHFLRWCEELTRGMAPEDAIATVRSILPSSLIGDHALDHWKGYVTRRSNVRYVSLAEEQRRESQSFRDSTEFRLRRALASDPGLHCRLNQTIKVEKDPELPRRLLAGSHDVRRFVADLEPVRHACRDRYGTERRILLRLIAETEKGGPRAALRFSVNFETSSGFRVPSSGFRKAGESGDTRDVTPSGWAVGQARRLRR